MRATQREQLAQNSIQDLPTPSVALGAEASAGGVQSLLDCSAARCVLSHGIFVDSRLNPRIPLASDNSVPLLIAIGIAAATVSNVIAIARVLA